MGVRFLQINISFPPYKSLRVFLKNSTSKIKNKKSAPIRTCPEGVNEARKGQHFRYWFISDVPVMGRNKLSGVWSSVASVHFFLVGLCCLNLLAALQKHPQLCHGLNSVFFFCIVVSMLSYAAIHFGVLLCMGTRQAKASFPHKMISRLAGFVAHL